MIVVGLDEHHRPRAIEGALPGRVLCVRNVETPSGSRPVGSGRLTVRNAQLLGGRRMTKKRTPAAETQRETATGLISALLLMVAEQPAGYRAPGGPGARAGLTWSGGPVRKKMTTTFRTNGQTGRRDGHGRRGEWTRGPPPGLASDRLAPGRARGTSVATTDLRGIKGRGPQKGPPVAEVDARLPLKRSGERAAGDRAQRWSSDRRRGRRGRADPGGQASAGLKDPARPRAVQGLAGQAGVSSLSRAASRSVRSGSP